MVTLYPFAECIARPKTDGQVHLLQDHLQQVAVRAVPERQTIEQHLTYLAALLHDAGKAHAVWQRYIRKVEAGQKLRSPISHSPFGAALFALFGWEILRQRAPERLRDDALLYHWMLGVRDIADHHGSLDDLQEELPWRASQYLIAREVSSIDWKGLVQFVAFDFPELSVFMDWDADRLDTWETDFREKWRKYVLRLQSCKPAYRRHLQKTALLAFRKYTGRLIFADRFDAGVVQGSVLDREMLSSAWLHYEQTIEAKKAEFRSSSLTQLRESIRQHAIQTYRDHPNRFFYTLHVPTGTGKTMAALGVALEACKRTGKQRIVYAAPYLSILSQVVEELEQATGLEVLQHHSLTWQPENEKTEWDEKTSLLMESWQAPIVATSFNQLFHAMFPARAQHAMRIPALENAVLIVDEPQIIDGAHWKLFLHMLQAAAEELHFQVILVSATMPVYQDVIASDVISLGLQLQPEQQPVRYHIDIQPTAWDEKELASQLVDVYQAGKATAAILNTIQDAALTYQHVKNSVKEALFLCGAMTPLHKMEILQTVKKRLKNKQNVLLVSTQVIEAGVDVSFDRLFRASSVLPSILQAAGRINRHAFTDDELGKLIVFPFLRNGETDTRGYVYRSRAGRDISDELLKTEPIRAEPDFVRIVGIYYKMLDRRVRGELETKLADAATGTWSEVAALSPFREVFEQISVFVPYGHHLLTDAILERMGQFDCDSIEEIYEKYAQPGFVESLDYISRKKFFGLMQLFLFSVHPKMAKGRAFPSGDKAIWRLGLDGETYRPDTGLAHLVGHEHESLFL